MSLTLEQQLFENFQKLDDATKHQLIARMQQALVAPISFDLATWQARMHPIIDVVDVLDSVRNEHTSS